MGGGSLRYKLCGHKEIRKLFRASGMLDRYFRDEYDVEVQESSTFVCRGRKKDSRAGSLSQTAWLVDKGCGERVALIHRYFRADGTLEASRKPDPKILVIDGVGYYSNMGERGLRRVEELFSDWFAITATLLGLRQVTALCRG
jgi:hypothetical protein